MTEETAAAQSGGNDCVTGMRNCRPAEQCPSSGLLRDEIGNIERCPGRGQIMDLSPAVLPGGLAVSDDYVTGLHPRQCRRPDYVGIAKYSILR
jgi:hypothetical protein